MSTAATKCPRCGGAATSTRALGEHSAAHNGVHQFAHHHPVAALVCGGIWVASKLLPRTLRCKACGHEFRG